MIDDPIVDEVRRARAKIFESCGRDIERYFALAVDAQKEQGDRLVSLVPKKKKAEPIASADAKRR